MYGMYFSSFIGLTMVKKKVFNPIKFSPKPLSNQSKKKKKKEI